jgi:hypothetical protein
MARTNRLQQHWRDILAAFFPRWKAASEWLCTTRTRRTGDGHCDPERRIIEIRVVFEDDDALDCLLIHESAHAVASLSHDKRWQRRIARAAARARNLGRTRLAELLDEEIVHYQEKRQPISVAYQEVQDAVFDNPDLTLAQIKRRLARTYGLLVREVGKSFPRLVKVYDKARQEGREFQKHQAAGRERLKKAAQRPSSPNTTQPEVVPGAGAGSTERSLPPITAHGAGHAEVTPST